MNARVEWPNGRARETLYLKKYQGDAIAKARKWWCDGFFLRCVTHVRKKEDDKEMRFFGEELNLDGSKNVIINEGLNY
jgi:hypothetical protein